MQVCSLLLHPPASSKLYAVRMILAPVESSCVSLVSPMHPKQTLPRASTPLGSGTPSRSTTFPGGLVAYSPNSDGHSHVSWSERCRYSILHALGVDGCRYGNLYQVLQNIIAEDRSFLSTQSKISSRTG